MSMPVISRQDSRLHWTSTFDTLARISNSVASGELIVVGDGGEARFYLFEGCLAWATSTNSAKVFVKHLKAIGVEQGALEAVMDECKKSGAHIMDTLIAWDVADQQMVRDALFVQVAEALAWVRTTSSLEQVFVPRDLDYNEQQTFSLNDIEEKCRVSSTNLSYRHVASAVHDATSRLAVPVKSGAIEAPEKNTNPLQDRKNRSMSNTKETLTKLMEIDGCIGACIVDSDSGMMLGSIGGGEINLEVAAAGNTEVVSAKRKTMKALGLSGAIEDILITLEKQYHLIRPLAQNDALFIYLVLDRAKSNLALSRLKLREAAVNVTI